jgi:hypothetical protein
VEGLGAVSVDGIGNVIALLEEIDNGKLQEIPYIEALAKDIVKSRAKIDDCIVRMKEKSAKIVAMSN